MKITKNAKNDKVEFYRDAEKGYLQNPKTKKDTTEKSIQGLNVNQSYAGRILAYSADRGARNPYYGFVQSLVKQGNYIDFKKLNNIEISHESIEENFSLYGRRLKYGKDDSTSLESLLLKRGKGEVVTNELRELKAKVRKLIEHKEI